MCGQRSVQVTELFLLWICSFLHLYMLVYATTNYWTFFLHNLIDRATKTVSWRWLYMTLSKLRTSTNKNCFFFTFGKPKALKVTCSNCLFDPSDNNNCQKCKSMKLRKSTNLSNVNLWIYVILCCGAAEVLLSDSSKSVDVLTVVTLSPPIFSSILLIYFYRHF